MALEKDPLILKYIELNNYGRLLGMQFSIESPGCVVYTMKVGAEHLATPNAAHGGAVASLLDSTIGVGALSAVCEEGKVVSTVEMNFVFMSPAFLNDVLVAKSKILKKGNRLLFMEAEILNQKGELVAKASGTLNAYPKEKAGY